MMQGEKSMDLVQPLQAAPLWYYPPDILKQLKLYQLGNVRNTSIYNSVSNVKFPGLDRWGNGDRSGAR